MVECVALPQARHRVTYREITLVPYLGRVRSLPRVSGSRVARLEEVARLGVSNATRKIARAALRNL